MSRGRTRCVVGLVLAILPKVVVAGSPGVWSWGEYRGTPSRSGRTPETAVVEPVARWTTPAGSVAVVGEPALAGCRVYLADGSGAIIALDRLSGAESWRKPRAYLVEPASVLATLAVAGSGELFAALPGDGAVRWAWSNAASELHAAILAYVNVNDMPPAGPDLASELVPTYLARMPENAIARRPMVYAAAAVAGDYAYQWGSNPWEYEFAVWWTDGDVLADTGMCMRSPRWPVSVERGGEWISLEAGSGTSRWRDATRNPSLEGYPSLPWGMVLWTGLEESSQAPEFPTYGRLAVTNVSGSVAHERTLWRPLRGPAAVDEARGRVFVSHGPAPYAAYFNRVALTIDTAINMYEVDHGIVPPTGDLASYLVPVYMWCMPAHPLGGREVQWSAVPSPGDYDYESDGMNLYRLTLWGEDGLPMAVFERLGQTRVAEDGEAGVAAFDSDLGRLWSWSTPTGTVPTPAVVRGDGSVVIGTSEGDVVALDGATGSTLWTRSAASPLSQSPAILADDRVVVVTDLGEVFIVAADGSSGVTVPAAALPGGPPTATEDGVIYLPGADGTLRAVRADGSAAWALDLSGGAGLALITAAVQADGWIVAGRSDGSVAAVSDSAWSETPPADPGNSLRLVRDGRDVLFYLLGQPRACSYNVRSREASEVLPSDRLVVELPRDSGRHSGAVDEAPRLYYRAYGVSCCARLQGPG